MYGKVVIVFLSLFLVLLSGLASSFESFSKTAKKAVKPSPIVRVLHETRLPVRDCVALPHNRCSR